MLPVQTDDDASGHYVYDGMQRTECEFTRIHYNQKSYEELNTKS